MNILKIIIGLFLFSFGIYGILINWWSLTDLLAVIIPMCLIFFGLISILAGISTIKEKKKLKIDG